MNDGSEQKLLHIERSWRQALDEFVQLFIDLSQEPTEAQLEALGAILGASHNEVRAYIARKANEQGSALLSPHLHSRTD